MSKVLSTKPIPNAASRVWVIRKILQPGVVLSHCLPTKRLERYRPVVYQNEPERQADSSLETDKASGDDQLPDYKQYLQGKDNIITQLQKIQDPHETQRREEQSVKPLRYSH